MSDSSGVDRTTIAIALGLAIFIAGLIGLVVIVGLVQRTLDPTGIAGILGGLFTGIISSILILVNKRGGGNGGNNTSAS